MVASRDDTCMASTAQPISATTASAAAPNVKAGFSQNFFGFSAQGSAMPAASNRRRPAFTLSARPSSSMSCGTRADQFFEIGDALRRQTAGEITLDDLVLDDEFTIHGGRRCAGRGGAGDRPWFTPEDSIRLAASIVVQNSADSGPNGPRGVTAEAHAPQKSQAPLRLVSAVGPTGSHPLMLRFLCPEAAAPLHIPRMGSRPVLRRGSQFAV